MQCHHNHSFFFKRKGLVLQTEPTGSGIKTDPGSEGRFLQQGD